MPRFGWFLSKMKVAASVFILIFYIWSMMLMTIPPLILIIELLSNMPAVTCTVPTHNSQFMMKYPADDILLYPFKNTKRYISKDEDEPLTKTSWGLPRRKISQPYTDPDRHVSWDEYAPPTRTKRNSSRRMISRPFFLRLLKSLGIHVRLTWKRNHLQLLLWP